MKELILKAKKEISLSIWKNDFELIKDELKIVKKRGVIINLFSFSDISLEKANNFTYKLSDPENLFPYRKISVVIDEKDTLVGENNDENVRKVFALGYHPNAMGYYTYALIIGNFIDYIIRANYKDFFELPFVGTTLKNKNVK